MNMSKTSEVLQGPDESSTQLYEHLCEGFHFYTPFNPEATKNQQMINATFLDQAQGCKAKIAETRQICWNER
jgi:hypothetical protein